MYFKRVKRKCSVRGCKNIDCFHISRNREVGNSVIICKDCLVDALKSVDNVKPEPKKKLAEPPALFYQKKHSENSLNQSDSNYEDIKEKNTMIQENVAEVVIEETNDESKSEDNDAFVCEKCGREYKTERAYMAHVAKCKGVK